MTHRLLLLTSLLALAGCTSVAVKRHALNQEGTSTDIRFQEVLDNLALVANNPASLPAYSSIYVGLSQITDTAQLASTTTMGAGAGAELITPQLSRGEVGNWTLDPLNAPEKLEALRASCQWVVCGPQYAWLHDVHRVLASPEQAPIRGRHFGVADRLAKLPPGWLYVSTTERAPRDACYRSECCGVSVWVMPCGMRGLADFTLILQDIARVDINSQTLQFIRSVPSDFQFNIDARLPPSFVPPEIQERTACPPPRFVSNTAVIAEVSINPCGDLVSDKPYYPYRVENVGSDAALRSQISAAGLH